MRQAGQRGLLLGGAGSPSPGTNWPSGCREKSRAAAVADGQGLWAGGPLLPASPLVGNLAGRPPTEATGLLVGLRTDRGSGDGSALGRAASVGRAVPGRAERGCNPPSEHLTSSVLHLHQSDTLTCDLKSWGPVMLVKSPSSTDHQNPVTQLTFLGVRNSSQV